MLKHTSLNLGPLKWSRSVAAGLCLTAFLFSVACKSDYPAASRQNRPGDAKGARQVKTARVEETPFGESVTAYGTLAAYDQTTASVRFLAVCEPSPLTLGVSCDADKSSRRLSRRITICAFNRRKPRWPRRVRGWD